jgi:hypothetical protein
MSDHPATLSVYIPTRKQPLRPIERLSSLSRSRSQPINHLAIDAILQYLDQEEQRSR